MRSIVCVFALLAVLSCSALAAEHTKDSLDAIRQNLAQKKAVLLDVRERGEWDEGHLKDARHLPLTTLLNGRDSPTLAEDVAKVAPKGKVVYCHCRAGVRAVGAAEILEKLGYDVRPLKQGYEELIEAGFPKAE